MQSGKDAARPPRPISEVLCALATAVLVACADESGATDAPEAVAAPRLLRFSELPARTVSKGEHGAPGSALAACWQRLDAADHRVAREVLAAEAWRPGALPAPVEGLAIFQAAPKHDLLGAVDRQVSDAVLHHPRRSLRRWDPALEPLAPGHYAVLEDGVVLALPEGERPDGEFRLSYRSDERAFGDLLALREIFAREAPTWGVADLGAVRRIATTLTPGRRTSWQLPASGSGTLDLAWGFRAEWVEAREDGIRRSVARSLDLRFTIGVDGPQGERVLYEERCSAADAERFFEVRLELEDAREIWVEARLEELASERRNGAGLALQVHCGDAVFLPTTALVERAPAPNVILIVLDTLRADYLGCYGNAAGYTPHLDRLAASGVLYERARSTSSWTLPAHASLFTSLPPTQHGVLAPDEALSSELPTVAGLLRAHGWRTAAFTDGGFLSPLFGLASGFGSFDSTGGGAERTFERAKRWILERKAPFFAFVQTYEVHGPYAPPRDLRERFVAPAPPGLATEVFDPDEFAHRLRRERRAATEAEQRFCREMYGAGLAHADRLLGAFLAELEAAGRLANTLVVVTSDHGEEFFEHGDLGHAHTLYEELLRVPLILRHPQRYAGGERRAHEVFLEDLPATIAELLDLPLPAEWRGIPVEEARPRDLLAALRNERGERAYAGFDAADRKWIHTPEGFYRTSRRCGWELYRLAADPGEREDLGASLDPAPFTAELERLLAKYALSAQLAPPVQPSSALLEQLRAFGYLQGR